LVALPDNLGNISQHCANLPVVGVALGGPPQQAFAFA